MQSNDINEKLFDSVLKIAAEEALEQEMEEMVSCEKLNNEYEPSPNLDRKIKRIILRYRYKGKLFVWGKAFGKIAIAMTIMILISGTVLLSVKATRNYIFNAVIRWQEDHFSMQHEDNESNYKFEALKPAYVPIGFSEVSKEIIGDIIIIIYQNENNQVIKLKQSPSQASHILADSEYKEYEEIVINEEKAYVFNAIEENDDNKVIWEYKGNIFTISSELASTELIMMGESIK